MYYTKGINGLFGELLCSMVMTEERLDGWRIWEFHEFREL